MSHSTAIGTGFHLMIWGLLCVGLILGEVTPPVYGGETEEFQTRGSSSQDDVITRGGKALRPGAPPPRRAPQTAPLQQRMSQETINARRIEQLQQQVNALRAHVDALRAVIQIQSHGATIRARSLRLRAEQVTLEAERHHVVIESSKDVKVNAGRHVDINANGTAMLRAKHTLNLKGDGTAHVQGSILKLNNGTMPVAKIGSATIGSVGVTSGSPPVLVP